MADIIEPMPAWTDDDMTNQRSIEKLEVILKVTERCNIDCTYCYYFNGNNQDYKDQPKHLSIDTAHLIAGYLRDAALNHEIPEIQIDLHGGEPLMIKKTILITILDIFRSTIPPSTALNICVQTNATLLDDEWISIFEKYSVSIGVSLDGPRTENDLHRIDKKGRGTHEKVTAAINKLNAANDRKEGIFAGIICVINPTFDGRKVYRHFVDDLRVKRIHFLNPNQTRDSVQAGLPEAVSRFLLEALEEWLIDGNSAIQVRQFNGPLKHIIAGNRPSTVRGQFVAMTVRADGQIAIDDDLRNTLPSLFKLGLNVETSDLADFLDHPSVASFREACSVEPPVCAQCGAKSVCRSGGGFGESVLHRYSLANKFKNASLFCPTHMAVIVRLGQFALSHGIPWSTIARNMSSV